jgi:hypothetical protein
MPNLFNAKKFLLERYWARRNYVETVPASFITALSVPTAGARDVVGR